MFHRVGTTNVKNYNVPLAKMRWLPSFHPWPNAMTLTFCDHPCSLAYDVILYLLYTLPTTRRRLKGIPLMMKKIDRPPCALLSFHLPDLCLCLLAQTKLSPNATHPHSNTCTTPANGKKKKKHVKTIKNKSILPPNPPKPTNQPTNP